jgi:hypothetical protein
MTRYLFQLGYSMSSTLKTRRIYIQKPEDWDESLERGGYQSNQGNQRPRSSASSQAGAADVVPKMIMTKEEIIKMFRIGFNQYPKIAVFNFEL